MKELKISTSKTKRMTYVFTFGVLTLIYLVLTYFNFITFKFGMTLCCITGGLTLYFLYTVYNARTFMTINNEGIYRKAFKGPKFIAWNEISEIYICVVPRKKYEEFYLGIKLNKEEGNTKKVKFKGKVHGEKGDIVITIDDMNQKPYDIYNSIQKYYKNLKK